MNLNLSGQLVVVAGAAQGIGHAIARAFAAEGSTIIALDRDPQVSTVAQGLNVEHGVPATAYVADVTDLAAVQHIAQELESARIAPPSDAPPPIHLVYAVGAGSGKFGFPFWNLQPADWSRAVEVNLLGAVNFTHAFVPLLTRTPGASVLFLGSVAGQIGSQTDPPYSAAKAALINFAQCAARDLASYDVRVNTLCPGMVKTALNRSVWEAWNRQQPPEQQRSYEEWANDKIQRVVPLGRWQEPEEMAAMAIYLASHWARNITGQALNVDGGFVMHW